MKKKCDSSFVNGQDLREHLCSVHDINKFSVREIEFLRMEGRLSDFIIAVNSY